VIARTNTKHGKISITLVKPILTNSCVSHLFYQEDNLEIILRPIAVVHSTRAPAQDDHWDGVEAFIELNEGFGMEALAGLEAFSHIEVLFFFDQVAEDAVETGARRPRGRSYWPETGIFAQRGKNRPNRLGATICTLLRTEGTKVFVHGLDAIDGTPVLDIKPVMTGFLPRGRLREPEWAVELMKDYW
jgi:tRNA (adenine37-N6)-methyltransferase